MSAHGEQVYALTMLVIKTMSTLLFPEKTLFGDIPHDLLLRLRKQLDERVLWNWVTERESVKTVMFRSGCSWLVRPTLLSVGKK